MEMNLAGNENSGKKRTPLPKGADAEKELARIKRNARRKARREAKAREAAGLPPEAGDELDTDTPLPVDGPVRPPTPEEFKAQLMETFNQLGGQAGLYAWGRRYPKEFYALWMKYCAPKEADEPEEDSLEAMILRLERSNDGETVQ